MSSNGHADPVDAALNTTFEQPRTEGVPTKDACALIGRARATHYRRLQPPVHGPAPARASPDNGQALSAAERAAGFRTPVLHHRLP